MPASGSTFRLDVIALVRDASGRSLPITLVRHDDTLVGELPKGTGLSLDSIILREDMQTASLRQHAIGEGGVDLPARTGRVVLGRPTADGHGSRRRPAQLVRVDRWPKRADEHRSVDQLSDRGDTVRQRSRRTLLRRRSRRTSTVLLQRTHVAVC